MPSRLSPRSQLVFVGAKRPQLSGAPSATLLPALNVNERRAPIIGFMLHDSGLPWQKLPFVNAVLNKQSCPVWSIADASQINS
jgi:hypothetical protein